MASRERAVWTARGSLPSAAVRPLTPRSLASSVHGQARTSFPVSALSATAPLLSSRGRQSSGGGSGGYGGGYHGGPGTVAVTMPMRLRPSGSPTAATRSPTGAAVQSARPDAQSPVSPKASVRIRAVGEKYVPLVASIPSDGASQSSTVASPCAGAATLCSTNTSFSVAANSSWASMSPNASTPLPVAPAATSGGTGPSADECNSIATASTSASASMPGKGAGEKDAAEAACSTLKLREFMAASGSSTEYPLATPSSSTVCLTGAGADSEPYSPGQNMEPRRREVIGYLGNRARSLGGAGFNPGRIRSASPGNRSATRVAAARSARGSTPARPSTSRPSSRPASPSSPASPRTPRASGGGGGSAQRSRSQGLAIGGSSPARRSWNGTIDSRAMYSDLDAWARPGAYEQGVAAALSSHTFGKELQRLVQAQSRGREWLKTALDQQVETLRKELNDTEHLRDLQAKRAQVLEEQALCSEAAMQERRQRTEDRFLRVNENKYDIALEIRNRQEARAREELCRQERYEDRLMQLQEQARMAAELLEARRREAYEEAFRIDNERRSNVATRCRAKDAKVETLLCEKRNIYTARRTANDEAFLCSERLQSEIALQHVSGRYDVEWLQGLAQEMLGPGPPLHLSDTELARP
eukprot:TRINITY_DN21904_c0_g1_i2.p1 TRINITY_DN21904_c0_g1~~TRINITY_DN21904_c0_g1_i2.p1  ORF type:complete len:644 (+),score=97.03 TRINITY_DN21904_c0_g1_i2:102-2033(+)